MSSVFHSVSTHNTRLDVLDNNWVPTVNAILGRVVGIFKWSGKERCSQCNTETATGFEISLVQHKAATDQSTVIAGLRAHIGRYHLHRLVTTCQVALCGLLIKANNRGGATKYCRHLTSLACISNRSANPD